MNLVSAYKKKLRNFYPTDQVMHLSFCFLLMTINLVFGEEYKNLEIFQTDFAIEIINLEIFSRFMDLEIFDFEIIQAFGLRKFFIIPIKMNFENFSILKYLH